MNSSIVIYICNNIKYKYFSYLNVTWNVCEKMLAKKATFVYAFIYRNCIVYM